VQTEIGERGGRDLGDDRHETVDMDADPVAEEIDTPCAAAPDVAGASLGLCSVHTHRVRLDRDVHVARDRVRGDHHATAVERDLVTRRDTVEQVHTHEVGHVSRARALGHLGHRAGLGDAAVLEDDESVGQRDRVEQLVRHDDARAAERGEV
jgi:hypothetical protein